MFPSTNNFKVYALCMQRIGARFETTPILLSDFYMNSCTHLCWGEYADYVQQQSLPEFRITMADTDSQISEKYDKMATPQNFILDKIYNFDCRYRLSRKIYYRVDDGWLIGINRGEFGGSVLWTDFDADTIYKVKDTNPFDFFAIEEKLCFIGGCSHLSATSGYIFKIERNRNQKWVANHALDLGDAPVAYCAANSGRVFVVTLNRIIEISADLSGTKELARFDTLWARSRTGCQHPAFPRQSCAIGDDENSLFIGAVGSVCEFDIAHASFRFVVIPNRQYEHFY